MIRRRRKRPLQERFWEKVDKTEGCWLWLASKDTEGYGTFGLNQVVEKAHRVAYTLVVGPVPKGLTLDHLCRNRACVNPRHLEAVSARDNTLRGPVPGVRRKGDPGDWFRVGSALVEGCPVVALRATYSRFSGCLPDSYPTWSRPCLIHNI